MGAVGDAAVKEKVTCNKCKASSERNCQRPSRLKKTEKIIAVSAFSLCQSLGPQSRLCVVCASHAVASSVPQGETLPSLHWFQVQSSAEWALGHCDSGIFWQVDVCASLYLVQLFFNRIIFIIVIKTANLKYLLKVKRK